MPGRNIRQCRERWKHYLSGEKLSVPWSKQEDQLLQEKVKEIGAKWTKIAAILGDRTDLEVKNRWMKKFNSRSPLARKTRRRLNSPQPQSPVADPKLDTEPPPNPPPRSFIFRDMDDIPSLSSVINVRDPFSWTAEAPADPANPWYFGWDSGW
jgi:hypothetical protein